ncbi:acyl carrier protein [Pseudozobellia sp. WGM2]|uniref:acyl carrier protein n=1 Tax=Pseudozobellia sp. WGM2 TaxID=2787625 RepID=UPI001AE0499F|nr:acyl carrier protein [Pseudozobellia sp. WGM2]
MKDKIESYIINNLASEPLDKIYDDEDLLGSGIVDSMGMMNLINFIETEADIKIPSEDMTIENFMTIKNIMQYLSR